MLLPGPAQVQDPRIILSQTGSLIYSSAPNTPAELVAGTTGYVLTMVGGLPVWMPGASTYTPPTLRAWYYGNPVTIPAGTAANLTWDNKFEGSSVLGFSGPFASLTFPYLTSSGTWSIIMIVKGTNLTPGANFRIDSDIDIYDEEWLAYADSGPASVANPSPVAVLPHCKHFDHGGAPVATPTTPPDPPINGASITVAATNYDSVDRDFFIAAAFIQKLS